MNEISRTALRQSRVLLEMAQQGIRGLGAAPDPKVDNALARIEPALAGEFDATGLLADIAIMLEGTLANDQRETLRGAVEVVEMTLATVHDALGVKPIIGAAPLGLAGMLADGPKPGETVH